jgi:acetyl-CoA carboxylase biotin carboxyl carrier protein
MGKLEVDQGLIRELAQLLEETGLGEIEIEDGDRRLRVARPQTVAVPAVAAPAARPAGGGAESEESAAPHLSAHPGAVTSPMVGTVYRAAEPGAEPFINVGDKVRRGQTLLVIEAMKTFNEIAAPNDGTVSQILVENASPVEFGEVLLVLE